MIYRLLQRIDIAERYRRGEKVAAIEAFYPGITPTSIRRIAREFGVAIRPQGRRRTVTCPEDIHGTRSGAEADAARDLLVGGAGGMAAKEA